MGLLDDAIREHLDLKRRRGADPTEVERLEHEALGPVRRGAYEPDDVALGPDYARTADREEAERDWVEPANGPALFDQAPDYHAPEYEAHEARAVGDHAPEYQAPEFVPDEHVEHEPELLEHEPEPLEPESAPPTPRHHEIAEEWDEHEPLDLGGPDHHAPAAEPFATDERFAAEPPPYEEGSLLEPDAHPPVPAEPARPAERPPQSADHLSEETVEYDVEAAQREEALGAEDVLEETPEFLQDTPDHDRLWFEQRPPRDFDFDG